MLRGVSLPLAYCDIDRASQQVLVKNIEKKLLPVAPIFPDVRFLADTLKQQRRSRADIVTASSPCIGLSLAGKREGLKHPDSALLHCVFKVIDVETPKIVLLENTPSIIAEMDVVAHELTKRGYSLAWTVLPAFAVGSPQSRERWWCLAWQNNRQLAKFRSLLAATLPSFKWKREHLPRTIKRMGEGHHARLKLLGNAIVPQCAAIAYWYILMQISKATRFEGTYPPSGFIDKTNARYKLLDPAVKKPDIGLILKSKKLVIRKLLWPTPRARKTGSCATLTDRCSRDLATALNFEIDSVPGYANPEWVEWLMGYQRGWTYFGQKSSHLLR